MGIKCRALGWVDTYVFIHLKWTMINKCCKPHGNHKAKPYNRFTEDKPEHTTTENHQITKREEEKKELQDSQKAI